MADPVAIDRTCAAPGCHAPHDPWLTARLLSLLPLLAGAMRLFGFRRTYIVLGRRSARRGRDPGARSPQHIAALVVHVNRHLLPYQSRCLLESLTLWYVLRRNGYPAELLLGARTLLGPFEAHAWVELDGEVLNDSGNVRDVYRPFALPATGPRPDSP
jgi:hypothetical protein